MPGEKRVCVEVSPGHLIGIAEVYNPDDLPIVSAAPDLLWELKLVEKDYEARASGEGEDFDTGAYSMLLSVRAAIAKAEGRRE